MCEIVRHQVYDAGGKTLEFGAYPRSVREGPIYLLNTDPLAWDVPLQCRHELPDTPGLFGAWETLPTPGVGEALEIPARSELRTAPWLVRLALPAGAA